MFNDYGYALNLSTIGDKGTDGFVPGTTMTFGPTTGCTFTSCQTYVYPAPQFGSPTAVAPSTLFVTIDLVARPSYATCKESGNTNCGNHFDRHHRVDGVSS